MELKHLRSSFIQRFSNNKIPILYVLSGGFVLVTILLGILISSVSFPVTTIIQVLIEQITRKISELSFGIIPNVDWGFNIADHITMIIWNIRFPRVLLAFCVGASLALAGAAFQGLLRNPLADPFTIGVSSGASLGAVLVIFFNLSVIGLGFYTLPVAAILGGGIALIIVFGLVRLSSRSLAIETIILAGIIIGSFISSIISLIISIGDRDSMTQILYWLYGSVAMRGWSYVQLIIPFMIIGAVILIIHYRELNAMALGEQSAEHIGVNVKRGKVMILIGASLLTGAAVAVSGTIGFVGLVIPHLIRMLTGPNHRYVLLMSMLVGGGFLILADIISRTIIAPVELPIGVITALIGAPAFAFLLIRERLGRR